MKILVLGSNGWLGGLFLKHLEEHGIETAHCSHHDVNAFQILETGITHVVNFASSTNIDWCEKNKNRTFWNNVLGAVNIAKVCKMAGAKYIFISSACIFQSKDVNDIKFEDAVPQPGCFYTETKVLAEKLIKEIDPDVLIVRPRLPISEVSHPRNTLDKIAKYKRLINCQESITIVEDLLPRILQLILDNCSGVYNVVNEGTISPAQMGHIAGFTFEEYTKKDLDDQIREEGKAPRVSTIVGSYNGYLPHIGGRIKEVIEKWKNTLKN
jgi:dTDP-4-dehydrorhamnose reductase